MALTPISSANSLMPRFSGAQKASGSLQAAQPRFGNDWTDRATTLPKSPQSTPDPQKTPDLKQSAANLQKRQRNFKYALRTLMAATVLAAGGQFASNTIITSGNTQDRQISALKTPTANYVELNTIRGAETLEKIRENMAGDVGKTFDHYALVSEYALPRVVAIYTKTSYGYFGLLGVKEDTASGFIYRKDGIIVTNHHVVAGKDSIQVQMQNGATTRAKVIGSDPAADVAVLRVDPKEFGQLELPTLALGDQAREGDRILSIGHPQKMLWTVLDGLISSTNRLLDRRFPMVQHDADTMEGGSGGPLVNMHGEVVAMNVLIAPGGAKQPYGFAIAAKPLKEIVEKLLSQEQKPTPKKPQLASTVE